MSDLSDMYTLVLRSMTIPKTSKLMIDKLKMIKLLSPIGNKRSRVKA
tara:strand:- start:2405 stop:2545 length:141 start_codon:yes stop_codon:yes gene_type:complete